jgi:hypothetical protein
VLGRGSSRVSSGGAGGLCRRPCQQPVGSGSVKRRRQAVMRACKVRREAHAVLSSARCNRATLLLRDGDVRAQLLALLHGSLYVES